MLTLCSLNSVLFTKYSVGSQIYFYDLDFLITLEVKDGEYMTFTMLLKQKITNKRCLYYIYNLWVKVMLKDKKLSKVMTVLKCVLKKNATWELTEVSVPI